MKWIYSIDNQPYPEALVIGGKAMALFQMFATGLPVPAPLCISTSAYDEFVDANHLREKIGLELYRKNIREMRWEEIWDASLRIQLLFLKGKISEELEENILEAIRDNFGDHPLAIRSSAPEEDGAGGSFAGLHESYINVSGSDEIIRKIKKVWASLWSDRAILYRQELGLEVLKSRMAVVVQPFIEGQVSGLLFTKNPLEKQQMVIEAVHGLNQGLVDGAVAPDRWLINRESLKVETHKAPEKRDTWFVRSSSGGIISACLDSKRSEQPPLDESSVDGIVRLGLRVEDHYRVPQDIEWTLADDQWCLLQARPITADSETTQGDKRAWYLSLTRSYDSLLHLWEQITQKLLPEMDEDAARLAAVNFDEMGNTDLALELRRRSDLNERWTAVYWSDFIPFAHGVRLFGEVYNDLVQPDDPFEFITLLTGQKMLSTERNDLLKECAELAAADDSLHQSLKGGVLKGVGGEEFQLKISRLRSHFSIDFVGVGDPLAVDKIICSMIVQYSLLASDSRATSQTERERLEQVFIDRAEQNIALDPAELLSMARESYRIRDDDNIHIGRIGQELERACEYARARLHGNGSSVPPGTSAPNLALLLEGETVAEGAENVAEVETPQGALRTSVRARQLQGQPASRGIASGKARVVEKMIDLSEFIKGEVLVIDAIDPTMTFFAPLAAAIIERRGGMLIHGAIIAREYGIPCITGVVGATDYISTGDRITVDGYLGICTVQRKDDLATETVSELSPQKQGREPADVKLPTDLPDGNLMESNKTPALNQIRKAKLLFASGQIRDSVKQFTLAEREGYELLDIWLSRGAALLALGRFKAAETDFSNVLEVQRDNERAYYYRGIAHAAQGRHQKAISDLTASLSRNNNRGIAHLIRGLSYAELGNKSDAVLDINSAGAFSDAELESFAKLFGTIGHPFRNAKAMLAEENAPWNNLLDRSSAEKLIKMLQ